MRWKKLGRVFAPDKNSEWMHSHAAVPIAEHISDYLFKIYFSTRDKDNRSFVGWVTIDLQKPTNLLDISKIPVLSPGELGAFDDSGSMATCLVNWSGKKYLYYIGWNLGVTVPFRNAIGIAVEDKTGKYNRLFQGPILDRTPTEPHFCASCCVLPGLDKWRMWYLSCVGWSIVDGKPQHRYHIKYTESLDGVFWSRKGTISIDFKNQNEYALSTPSVIKELNLWRMWYSFRGDKYRIGYAESLDGIVWDRKDEEVGINVSDSGWDSEMIEYPFVFDHKGDRYMLYNGNDYGRTGFGLAILDQR